MQDLMTLFGYNTWANAKVFDLAAQQDPHIVTVSAPGTRDTVTVTLAHLASVEYAYLTMLERRTPSSREEMMRWAAHDLAWFPGQMRQIGAGFARLLETSTDESLAAPLNVPWFDFALTCREGLIQVLSHSAQHRSQVLSWLSAQGISTPDLDYVLMVREAREAARPRTSE
jgi:uncharacterized damage-inducible protein DinB